jgi:hypothetical protein
VAILLEVFMSSVIDPSANAFFFTIKTATEELDAFIDVNEIQGDHYFDCRYRKANSPDSPWTFLSMGNNFDAQFNESRMTTAAGALAELDRMLERCNLMIVELLGGYSKIPASGIELIEYLMRTRGIECTNNELHRVV